MSATACASATLPYDPRANVYQRKARPEQKIDAAALIMASGGADGQADALCIRSRGIQFVGPRQSMGHVVAAGLCC